MVSFWMSSHLHVCKPCSMVDIVWPHLPKIGITKFKSSQAKYASWHLLHKRPPPLLTPRVQEQTQSSASVPKGLTTGASKQNKSNKSFHWMGRRGSTWFHAFLSSYVLQESLRLCSWQELEAAFRNCISCSSSTQFNSHFYHFWSFSLGQGTVEFSAPHCSPATACCVRGRVLAFGVAAPENTNSPPRHFREISKWR